jgi:hypothetical protein
MHRFILIALLFGASASAADPVVRDPYNRPYPRDPYRERYDTVERDGYYDRERSRYDRFDRTRWDRDYRSRWVTLANAFSAQTHRQFIPVRGQRFDRLRIESVRGAPRINQVAVIYVSGATQVIKMNVRLPRGSGEVLRLNDEPIQRIVVYTDPRFGGAYGLYAAHGPRNRFSS